MTRPFSPCVALSETSQIHQTFGTIPIVAEMDMSNNADELYAETFGPNATREERHGKNYNCMISMSQKVSSLVDALLSRLLEVLSLRTKSYTDSIAGAFDEKFNKPRQYRHANDSNGLFDILTVDASLNLDQLPEMDAVEPLAPNSDSDLAFVQLQNLPDNPDDLPLGLRNKRSTDGQVTNKLDNVPDSTTLSRNERAVSSATSLAITVGLANLALSGTMALYYNSRIENLNYVLCQMVDQMTSFGRWSGKIKGNVQMIKNEFTQAACRLDSLYEALSRLGEQHACTKLATTFLTDLSSLASTFDQLFDLLVTGQMSPKVISVSTLQTLMDQAFFFENMLVKRFPLSFYSQSSLSLLSVDASKQTIRILIATPRIADQASYHRLTLLTAVTSVKLGSRFYDKEIDLPNTELAIPIEISKQYGFKLEKMNKEQISRLRIPLDCGRFQKVEYCRDFVPLSKPEQDCIFSLLHDDAELSHHCKYRMTRREKHTPWYITKSATGSLLSTTSDVDVYGVDRSKSPGLQEVFLTNGRFGSTKKGICLFISSVFSALKLVGRSADFRQNLTLSQNTDLFYTSTLATSSRQFSIEHYRWFETETGDFSMQDLEKFVDIDHRMGLLDMDLEPVHIDFGSWNWSLISVMVVGTAAAVGVLYIGFGCKYGRRWIPRCPRGNVQRGGGDAEAGMSSRVRGALPGQPVNPPYARFNQNQGVPRIIINAAGADAAHQNNTRRSQRRRHNEAIRVLARAIFDPNAPNPNVQAAVGHQNRIGDAPPPYGNDQLVAAPPPLPSGAVEANGE